LYSSPLLRLNFGLPRGMELISELEVRPGRAGLTDAALGAKMGSRAGKVERL
jgi:hypothetical protein